MGETLDRMAHCVAIGNLCGHARADQINECAHFRGVLRCLAARVFKCNRRRGCKRYRGALVGEVRRVPAHARTHGEDANARRPAERLRCCGKHRPHRRNVDVPSGGRGITDEGDAQPRQTRCDGFDRLEGPYLLICDL